MYTPFTLQTERKDATRRGGAGTLRAEPMGGDTPGESGGWGHAGRQVGEMRAGVSSGGGRDKRGPPVGLFPESGA